MTEATSSLQKLAELAYASSAPAFPAISLQEERDSSARSGKFIFVIDHSPTIQKIVEIALRREGHDIRLFGNGIEAMKWFAQPEARVPDLMLVDLGLPKMDGYDVIQKFKTKQCFAKTTCILLSRHDEGVDKRKIKKVGAVAHITKPFTTQQLVAVVQTTIAGKSLYAYAGV